MEGSTISYVQTTVRGSKLGVRRSVIIEMRCSKGWMWRTVVLTYCIWENAPMFSQIRGTHSFHMTLIFHNFCYCLTEPTWLQQIRYSIGCGRGVAKWSVRETVVRQPLVRILAQHSIVIVQRWRNIWSGLTTTAGSSEWPCLVRSHAWMYGTKIENTWKQAHSSAIARPI